MIREILIHVGHKMKLQLKGMKTFKGRGVLLNIADKIIAHPRQKILLRTLYGFKLIIDPLNDNGVEKSIYYTGTYEPGTLHVFDYLLKPADVFFDVGSNIGLMAIYASQKIGVDGMVHSFEPEPDTFSILERNCHINKIQNVRLNNIALGSEEKEGVIYPNRDINRGASSLVRKDHTPGKKVWVTTLDAYITKHKIDQIKLIKIDIEGYELEMLKGARKVLNTKIAPMLCIEYSEVVESLGDIADLYDFIKGINEYHIFKFSAWKGEISKLTEVFCKSEMPKHDNVFCFLPFHLNKVNAAIFEKTTVATGVRQ